MPVRPAERLYCRAALLKAASPLDIRIRGSLNRGNPLVALAFTFDAVGAQLTFTHLIAACRQIRDALFALPVYAVTTIKSTGRIAIDFHRCRFCLVKFGDFMHLGGGGKEKGKYGGGQQDENLMQNISVFNLESAGYLIASRQENRTRSAHAGGNQGEALAGYYSSVLFASGCKMSAQRRQRYWASPRITRLWRHTVKACYWQP